MIFLKNIYNYGLANSENIKNIHVGMQIELKEKI
jgi:hypothetical protein